MTRRVLVADDHPLVRRGVSAALFDVLGQVHVVEAETTHEALAAVTHGPLDLVVLDLAMPGGDPLDLIEAIRVHAPRLPVLVFTMYEEPALAVRLLRAGADGFVAKTRPADELVEAVVRLLAGRKYVDPELAEYIAGHLDTHTSAAAHEGLSKREFQVLLGLGAGRTVSEIAESLHLSVKTVSTYRARLLEKMGMTTNAQLVRYVVDHELDR
ncbi:MAG: response regulator transcription factor [Myxococcales bacterium]|nr:response regulator transcription factor [Myxococcales bacterium]